MGRRSLAKRVLLTASNLKKASIRTGLKVEKRVVALSQDLAGPEAVQKMAGCQSNECLCQKTREEMFKTHMACLPHKINRFKDEYSEFKEKVCVVVTTCN